MRSGATEGLLSRREAAELARVPLGTVDKAIEEKVVRVRRRQRSTLLSVDDLAIITVLRGAGLPLPRRTKQRVRRWIYEKRPHRSQRSEDLAISDVLVLRWDRSCSTVIRRADDYVRARERYIERDPAVMSGEPVIKGTRIPVRVIAARAARGETIDELHEDYPRVPRKALETALLYARAHPPRGRPAPPWRG